MSDSSTVSATQALTQLWLEPLREFSKSFLPTVQGFDALASKCALVLHGSTTFGVNDSCSDLDIWLFTSPAALIEYDQCGSSRFIEFKRDGKKGHFNVVSTDHMLSAIERCDMPLIAELRRAQVIDDRDNLSGVLLSRAQLPMLPSVRLAWFRYHYVEMRGDHRSCDSPIERGHAPALLIALTKAIEHALRAATILDGQPYHYSKWLAPMAACGRTGSEVSKLVDELIELLGTDALRLRGNETLHPLNLKMKEIRNVLVESAHASGVDGPWLEKWWLYIDHARQGIKDVTWSS